MCACVCVGVDSKAVELVFVCRRRRPRRTPSMMRGFTPCRARRLSRISSWSSCVSMGEALNVFGAMLFPCRPLCHILPDEPLRSFETRTTRHFCFSDLACRKHRPGPRLRTSYNDFFSGPDLMPDMPPLQARSLRLLCLPRSFSLLSLGELRSTQFIPVGFQRCD